MSFSHKKIKKSEGFFLLTKKNLIIFLQIKLLIYHRSKKKIIILLFGEKIIILEQPELKSQKTILVNREKERDKKGWASQFV